jgi:predicted nucleotidyltransferase
MGVFGSYARGEATENSDIDIAVELSGPMGLNFVSMANEIFTTKSLHLANAKCPSLSREALVAPTGRISNQFIEQLAYFQYFMTVLVSG